MKIQYYSEILCKYFDSEKELLTAEKAELKKKADAEASLKKATEERKARIAEIDVAREKYNASRKVAKADEAAYKELLMKFCKDYPEGYHTTYKANNLFDIFNSFWNF